MSESPARAHPAFVRLILARHGEASGNREMRYLGRTDAPLTDRGEAQARQLAAALSGFSIAAIYSSPLQRAAHTAAAIAEVLGLPVVPLDDLREQDFGAWENRTRAEVLAEDAATLAAWESGAEVAPPEGEAALDVRTRVVACANELAARHPGQTLVLASHVGPIKALICAALGLPPSGAFRLWLDPASFSVLDWRPGGNGSGILRVFNSIAHLEPARWLRPHLTEA